MIHAHYSTPLPVKPEEKRSRKWSIAWEEIKTSEEGKRDELLEKNRSDIGWTNQHTQAAIIAGQKLLRNDQNLRSGNTNEDKSLHGKLFFHLKQGLDEE